MSESRKKLSKNEEKYYIDNKKLYDTLVEYKEEVKRCEAEGKEKPRIPYYIGYSIKNIAEKYSTAGNWRNYSYRDEMVSDGIENCLKYFENFNAEKYKNPLAYFTEICTWAFVRRIKEEQKQQYLKYKYAQKINLEDQLLNDDIDSMSEDIQRKLQHGEPLYDNMLEFISEFERKIAEKKAKVALSKKAIDTDE